MRHLKKGKKFHRKKGQRNALIKSLADSLIIREKIETSEVKAKEIKPVVEKLTTMAKRQTLADFRLLKSRLPKKSAEKLYYHIAPRYVDRKGGYLRIIKSAKMRKNDGAKMAIIEFV